MDPTPPAAPWIGTGGRSLALRDRRGPARRSARRWARRRPRCSRCPPGAGRGCGPPPPCTQPAPRRGSSRPAHPLAHGQAGGAVAQLADNTRQLVSGHARGPVAAAAISPRARPVQLSRGEPGRVDAHDPSFSAAWGCGRSDSVSPAAPAARSRTVTACTTIPFCDRFRSDVPPGHRSSTASQRLLDVLTW